jgi:hypothetical protein
VFDDKPSYPNAQRRFVALQVCVSNDTKIWSRREGNIGKCSVIGTCLVMGLGFYLAQILTYLQFNVIKWAKQRPSQNPIDVKSDETIQI